MPLQQSTATAPLFSGRLWSTPKRAEFGWDEAVYYNSSFVLRSPPVDAKKSGVWVG
jgi:hypothetical protein